MLAGTIDTNAPSRLLLIRHAQTDLAGTFCGSSDPPVNERGELQIQALLERVKHDPFEAVYSSDLQRATATAKALARTLPVITRPALREIDFGAWEGRTWSEIERDDPAYAQRWIDDYPNLPAPGGERFVSFQARVLAEFEELLGSGKPVRAAVVTHAGVMRVILTARCGVEERESWELTRSYCSFFAYPYMAFSRAREATR